jgi:uncharacterized cysteine cluster protein YcgN (CxxCxxCC family)
MADSVDKNETALRESFWEMPLSSLNSAEWEALCDGCGRCCLKKFVDENADKLVWTRVVCQYFDQETSRCGCYDQRSVNVPDCIDVKTLDIQATNWMPDTCAYKLRALGKPLYAWHPLISGSREGITDADITISNKVISEEYVHPEGYEEHIIRWVSAEG